MKMSSASLLAALAFAATVPTLAMAAAPTTSQYPETTIARLSAQIRSSSDLASYLHRTPLNRSPLRFLEPTARQQFLSKLTFDSVGLSGFSYAEFAGLTPTQAYQILALFGLERTVSGIDGLKVQTPLDGQIMALPSPRGGEYNALHDPTPPFRCFYNPKTYCNFSG